LLGVAVSEGDDTARAMARDLDVFRKQYQWVDDDALEFYKLHAGIDVEHGLIRKEILKKASVKILVGNIELELIYHRE
jgi:hypothetical protein